ncbi:hypothetical protein ABBQ32_009529 [Trebouxia sp. C0010 RCD-2024]
MVIMLSALMLILSGTMIDWAAGQPSFELGDPGQQVGLHHYLGTRLTTLRAHQAAVSSESPKISSFTCTGLKWGEDNKYGCPLCRTCRFNNVCFNHSSQDIQYYKGTSSLPLFHDASNGQPHHQFPTDFVNTGHLAMSPSPMDWAPKAMPGAIPSDAVFSDAPVVAYVSLNDAVFNFGHALFDFLFPVFNTLQLMDMYHPDFQLLLAKHQGNSPHLVELFIDPPEAERSMLPLISHRPVLTRDALAAQATGSGQLTCFSSFVAGSGSLHTSMQRTRALPFRAAAFANLGIVKDAQRSTPRITMLKKKGKRIVENADSIMSHLRTRFPAAEFETLEGKDIAVMSLKQQLEAMSRTDILITPCGGVGTVLTFLPPGATAIVMNYWQTTAQTSVQMERNYYWNLEYLDIQYFPVLAEDYDLTTDRPSCEQAPDGRYIESQGAFIACNVYIKNLARIEDMVGTALQRWMVEHNRHDAADSW